MVQENTAGFAQELCAGIFAQNLRRRKSHRSCARRFAQELCKGVLHEFARFAQEKFAQLRSQKSRKGKVTRSCAESVTSLLLKMLNREKKRSFLFRLRGEGWCPVTPVGCRMVLCGPFGAGWCPVTPAGCRMVPCRPQDEGWSFFLRRGTSGSLAARNRQLN